MIRVAGLVLVWFPMVLTSCKKEPTYIASKARVLNMAGSAEDVQLPTELWDKLESHYLPMVMDQTTQDEEGTRTKLEIPKEFFAFHVYLTEKTEGVLGNESFDLLYGKGGGSLDLKDFISLDRGSFYLGFKPILDIEKTDRMFVYFLSNSRKRKIGPEIVGSGCYKYLDITDYFTTRMNGDGLLINVSQGRHVSLLVGTYFFVASIKGKLFLSQLTIKDSRFKKLHCQWR